MHVFKKFIIETDEEHGDCLIIAKCTYHKQLATDKSKVKGGGMWDLDLESKEFKLYGESVDFGRCSVEDLASCVQRKKVFTNASLTRKIPDDFYFTYTDWDREVYDLKKYPLTETKHG